MAWNNSLKKLIILSFLGLIFIQVNAGITLEEFLKDLPVTEVRLLDREFIYDSILEVMIEQPLDHNNPDGKKFRQRLYISHYDPEQPVVLVTEGYDAKYYYNSEIALELRCNQIIVEHRYFGRSVPDSVDYRYLDTWQAASDYHNIINIFKQYYPGPWIATGISKGGQTVMYNSYYYPDDIDVNVPYVAPLNFSIEDPRIYDFLESVGKRKDRKKVFRFQKMMLKQQDKFLPEFREFSDDKGYSYELAGGTESAYEYCVLEYSFAFWQWGYVPASRIPGHFASPEEAIQHMNKVAGFDYFSDQSIIELQPFFYQALTEMGYYGYNLDLFSPWLRHVTNPVFTFTLPGMTLKYNDQLNHLIHDYLVNEAEHFVFIYGQNDTWSATGVFDLSPDATSKVFIKEGGCHRTRINNMPDDQREEVYRTIRVYMKN